MKLQCDNCGIVDHVLVDGYPFGDRLLEGVMFVVEDKNGKPHAISVVNDAKYYFSNLNEKRWLKACEGFCEHLDIAQCPKCGDDMVVWGNTLITSPPAPKVIQKTRGCDFLKARSRKGKV